MEGVYYELNDAAQFWGELDEILDPVHAAKTEVSVETAVRNFVRFTAAFRGTLQRITGVNVGEYLLMEEDVEQCCAKLFRSELFIKNSDVARYELISIANEVCTLKKGLMKGGNGQFEVVYCILGTFSGWSDGT
jgi:hypothetical protein